MKRFALVLLAVFSVMALAGPAIAKQDGAEEALALGADRMVSLQGTYGGVANSWEWRIGTGGSGANIQGISATGLVAAYEKTKNYQYLSAAIATGNTLVDRYNAAVAGLIDPDNLWPARPYSQDIEFLAWLSRESKNPVYGDVAAKWYGIIPAFKTAAQLVDRYIVAGRASMAGWDIASQIRAALAVGQKDYAKAVAAELIRRSAEWVNIPAYGWDYTALSYASLLWSLDQTGDSKEVIDQYRNALLALQAADGSWDEGSYQTTAYAVIGLSSIKGKGAHDSLTAAGTFLVSSQAANGGWAYVYGAKSYEYGEENSEVLISLAALLKGGNITKVQKVKLPKPKANKEVPKVKAMR